MGDLFLRLIVLGLILVVFRKHEKKILVISILLLIGFYFVAPRLSANIHSSKSWEVPRSFHVIMDKAVEYEARYAVWPENLVKDLPDAYSKTRSKKWEYSVTVIKDTVSVDTFIIIATSKKKIGKLPVGSFITIDNWRNKQYSHEYLLKMGGSYLSDAEYCDDE